MPSISAAGLLRSLVKKIGNFLQTFRAKKKLVSYNSFIPGKVYQCSYKSRPITLLCVSNGRTGSNGSVFTSTRNNKLLSCFAIDELDGETIREILIHLNNDDGSASYVNLDGYVTSLIGRQSYITPYIRDVSALYELDLVLQDDD